MSMLPVSTCHKILKILRGYKGPTLLAISLVDKDCDPKKKLKIMFWLFQS